MKYFALPVLMFFFGLMTSAEAKSTNLISEPVMETATIGGGCFWCVEAVFQRLNGVEKVVSGYAGGQTENPTYREVVSGSTGHAEVVQITYDPEVISFTKLLEVFFLTHNPTTLNRQGADVGTQYRSIILWKDEQQKQTAEVVIKMIDDEKIYDNPIVTQVVPLEVFYEAEEYHQDYFNRNPEQAYCQVVIAPKLQKLRELFEHKINEEAF